jgi:hypothetical protein
VIGWTFKLYGYLTWPVLVWQVHCAGLASSLELFSGHFWKNVTSSCYEITCCTFFFRISGYVLGALDVRKDRVWPSLVRIQSTSWCMLKGLPEANHILIGKSSINGPCSSIFHSYVSLLEGTSLVNFRPCWIPVKTVETLCICQRELRLLRKLVHSRALHWLSLEQRQRQDLERTPGAFEKTPGSCGKFNHPPHKSLAFSAKDPAQHADFGHFELQTHVQSLGEWLLHVLRVKSGLFCRYLLGHSVELSNSLTVIQ